jgi:hypothetical protein
MATNESSVAPVEKETNESSVDLEWLEKWLKELSPEQFAKVAEKTLLDQSFSQLSREERRKMVNMVIEAVIPTDQQESSDDEQIPALSNDDSASDTDV